MSILEREELVTEVLWEIIAEHDPDEQHPEDQAKCRCGETIGYRENYSVITDPYGHLIEKILEAGFTLR